MYTHNNEKYVLILPSSESTNVTEIEHGSSDGPWAIVMLISFLKLSYRCAMNASPRIEESIV